MKSSDVGILEPCGEDWDAMTPAQRGRFCAACQKTVHDLSAMTEPEARALLRSGQNVCVSFVSNRAGVIRFRPQPVLPASRLARRTSVAATAGISLALAACAPWAEGAEVEEPGLEQSATPYSFEPTIPVEEGCELPPPPRSERDEESTEPQPPEQEPKPEQPDRVEMRTAGIPVSDL